MKNEKYEKLQTVIETLQDLEKDTLKVRAVNKIDGIEPSDKITLLIESSRLAIQLGRLLKGIYDYEEYPENVGITAVIDDYFNEVGPLISMYRQQGIEEIGEYDLSQIGFSLSLFTRLLNNELKLLWIGLWNKHVTYGLKDSVETRSLDLMIKGTGKVYKFNTTIREQLEKRCAEEEKRKKRAKLMEGFGMDLD